MYRMNVEQNEQFTFIKKFSDICSKKTFLRNSAQRFSFLLTFAPEAHASVAQAFKARRAPVSF